MTFFLQSTILNKYKNKIDVKIHGGIKMIEPKKKVSKARRNKRRAANFKMTAPTLVKCSKCGELMMPHRVCKNCGSYNQKEIVAVD